MSIWSGETLVRRLPSLIFPFDFNSVENCSYELRLGSECFTTDQKDKRSLEDTPLVRIPPGQMALLITEEAVEMPPDALGLISIRSKYKMKGLINVSGFHVDPGFRGKLIFAVYNASERDVVLSRGDKVFVIWFLNLDQPTRYFYSGRRNDQSRISSDDVESIMGQIASPAVLAQQLQELKLEFSNFRAQVMGFASIVIAPLIIGLVLGLVNYSLPRWFAPSSSPQVQIEAPIENPLLDTIDAPSGVE